MSFIIIIFVHNVLTFCNTDFVRTVLIWQSTCTVVWLSGNVLVSINVVTLRSARLVPGWVTIFGWVNHFGAEPGTKVYVLSPSHPCVGRKMSTQQKLG